MYWQCIDGSIKELKVQILRILRICPNLLRNQFITSRAYDVGHNIQIGWKTNVHLRDFQQKRSNSYYVDCTESKIMELDLYPKTISTTLKIDISPNKIILECYFLEIHFM